MPARKSRTMARESIIDAESRDSTAESYLSPKELSRRWSCSRSTAQRTAERAGIPRLYLGEGRNGLVRYPLSEIKAFERRRTIGA